MIVSHEHRFIFVKTRKTAGTSIEVFLDPLVGEDAIVTPVHPPVDGHRPRHHDELYNPVRQIVRTRSVRKPIQAVRRGRSYYNHMPAQLIRERLGAKRWRSYYKFCFERDPWDKVVSWYHYRVEDPAATSFRDFVLAGDLPSDFDMYSLDGEVAVDFVGRYEDLDGDLARALAVVGIDAPVQLPRAKGGMRPTDATVEQLYTPELDDRVARVFGREIERFGYPDRSRARG